MSYTFVKKVNLSEAEYLEILKYSKNPEFSQSMVYYKGKVLGRCPKGTIKTGKTCVPTSEESSKTVYKKPQDLGGINPEQAKNLSKKNTSTRDIKKIRKIND